jgi:3-deoxy-D-manno-octulosonic acid kinase
VAEAPAGAIGRGPDWAVLYDEDLVVAPTPALFDPEQWGNRITGRAGRGRAGVIFVRAGDHEWALRHYWRGGMVAVAGRDRYLWLGEARTRSFREWRLLARLHALGLPVPRPVGAAWRRRGLLYRADLATLRLPATEPLSARLRSTEPVPWAAVGRTIRRFHDAGACHADLNAHNVLIGAAGESYLLDFDRGRILRAGSWREANLARLERSLRKVAAEPECPPFDERGWQALLTAYRAG